MSFIRQLARGLRALTNRRATDADVNDEVQHYLERATAAHMASGLSREDALRTARMELGGVTGARERVRSYGWENAVEALFGDLRYAARRLRNAPGFTTITVFTLALGIGGTTAIYSAVRPVVFEPVPYADPDRLAMVVEGHLGGGRSDGTFGMYKWLDERNRSFEALAVFRSWQPTITGTAVAERLAGQRVSAAYFRVLGVAPAIGRAFDATEDVVNGPNVVVLSDAFWRRHFGADSAIVGRQITLNDNSYVVVGIMSASFENVLAPHADLWAPAQYGMAQGRAWGHHLGTVGRLRPGVSADQATQEIHALGRAALAELKPETYAEDAVFTVTPLADELTRGVKPTLFAVAAAVLLVLVIACVNVTNLLLARGVRRRSEFALRAALGAGRGRLLRQLLTESLLLSAMGGIAGVGVATAGVRALVALSPSGFQRASAISVDNTVLVFGFVVSALVGLIVGFVPALQAARSDPQHELQKGSRRAAGGHRRTRSALVVVEVSLAVMLLVGSGLLLRSLQRLFAIPSGFDSSSMLTMQIQTAGPRFSSADATYTFFDQVLDAVRRVPGVTGADLTSQLPFSGDHDEYGVHIVSGPGQRRAGGSLFRYAVSPGYIELMRIPVRRGRAPLATDHANAPPIALVSESFAQRAFPGVDAIGQRVWIGPTDGEPYTVVGVVGDVKQLSLAAAAPDAVYTTASQWLFPDRAMSLVVRVRGNAAGLAPSIREAVQSVDKNQPIQRIATMDDLLAATAADRRFALVLFQAFALAALVLAAAGIYGVLAATVAERTREIGVRSALGASSRVIVGLVVRQGLSLTSLGVAIGVAASLLASEVLVSMSMLFRVSRFDPLTYAGVMVLLIAVAALACGVPAWRAARIDPVGTLRAE